MATNSEKIRLGIIGANIHLGWAPRSHLPAVVASPEFELTAVCTTRMESAEESAKAFGARLAFDNYQDLIAHPEIDAVAVVLRVPSHYEPTMAGPERRQARLYRMAAGTDHGPGPGDGGPGPGRKESATWWACRPGKRPPSST